MLTLKRLASASIAFAVALGAVPGIAAAQEDMCPDLTLATASAQAYDTITVTGLPDTMQAPILAAVFDVGDAAGVVTFLSDDAVFVPPHPTKPFDGGRVLIEISDGETVCAPRELSIAPLERSDGATRDLVEQLTATIEEVVVMIGADIHEISQPGFESDNPLEMWLSVYGRWLAWDDDSVLSQIEEMEDGDLAEAMALVDAAIGRGGFVSDARIVREAAGEGAAITQENQKDKFGFLLPFDGAPDGSPEIRFAASGEMAAFALMMQAQNQPTPLVELEGDYIGEAAAAENGAELANMMEWQFTAEVSGKPEVGIYRDAAGLVLGAGGTFLEKAGAGTAFSKVGTAYKTGADALFVMAQLEKVVAGLYPAEFVRLEIEYAPDKLELRDGKNEGAVTAIKVIPRSKGLELTKIAADIALANLPVGDTAVQSQGRFGKWLRNVQTPIGDNVYMHAENVGKLVDVAQRRVVRNRATAGIRQAGANVGDGVSKSATSMYGIGSMPDVMKIMPFEYPPVDIMQQGYYELRSSNAGVVQLGFAEDDAIPYTAISEGVSLLMASSAPGKFANNHVQGTGLVRVGDDTELSVSPQTQVVFPGDEAAITIVVRDADNLSIDWQISPAAHAGDLQEAQISTDSDGETISISEMIVTTSSSKDDFPAQLEVWLKDRPDVREVAYIESPRISPQSGCVPWGVEKQYTINMPPLSPVSVSWSVQGAGRIDQDGVFIAEGSGRSRSFTVIASNAATGEEIDRADQTVGCTCSWTYSVGNLTGAGDRAHIRTFRSGTEQGFIIDLTKYENDEEGIIEAVTMSGQGDPYSGIVEPFEFECDEQGYATNVLTGSVTAIHTTPGILYSSGADLVCPRRQSQQQLIDDGNCPDIGAPSVSLVPLGGDMVRGTVSGPASKFDPSNLRCDIDNTFTLDFTAARSPVDMSGMEELARQAEEDPSSIDPMAMMQQMMNMAGGEDLCAPDDY